MIISILLFFSLAGPAPQQTFAIYGSVRDSRSQAVGDVRVWLTDENYQPISQKFADNSGRFSFRGLKSGRYTLRIDPTGKPFEEQTQTIELQASTIRRDAGEEIISVDVVLKPKKSPPPRAEPGLVFTQDVPPSAKTEYERGAESLKENKSAQGIESLERAIAIFPDYFLALELLGTERVKREAYDQAVPVLEHAVEINQRAPKSLYALGVAKLRLNRSAEAVETLKAASEMDPQNVNAHMMLGLAYGSKNPNEAEACFKRAYELGGERAAEVHLYLAGIYNKQEKYTAAVRELELFLREAKDIKNSVQIKELIDKLKAKEKAKK